MKRCKSFSSYLKAARNGCQKGLAGPEKGKGQKPKGKEPDVLLMLPALFSPIRKSGTAKLSQKNCTPGKIWPQKKWELTYKYAAASSTQKLAPGETHR